MSDAALACANAYRAAKGLCPLQEAKHEEFVEDNLEHYLCDFCGWLSSHLIPQHLDEKKLPELVPKNPKNKKHVMCSSLKKHVSGTKELLKSMFPQHPDFQSQADPDPSWFSTLLLQFETECTRCHLTVAKDDDTVFGDTDVKPLHRSLGFNERVKAWHDWKHGMTKKEPTESVGHETVDLELEMEDEKSCWPDYTIIAKPQAHIDVKAILHHLMEKADPAVSNSNFEKRCWILQVYLSAGRGGEVKFQNYADWDFNYYLQCLNTQWTQPKVLKKLAMGIVADKSDYEMDFFHALGCCWGPEHGLHRSPEKLKSALSNYVCPSLHATSDSKVTTKLTDVLRAAIADLVLNNHGKVFSAKSLRKGAISTLTVHDQLGVFDVAARSGHSTQTSLDYYVDKTNVELGLGAGKILSGHSNAKALVWAPRLEALGDENMGMALQFMDCIITNQVPYFDEGNPLYCLRMIAAASLLMYHNNVTHDLGPHNAISSYMLRKARATKLRDYYEPTLSPECCLARWSTVLYDHFHDVNGEHTRFRSDSIPAMARSMEALSDHCVRGTSAAQELKRSVDACIVESKKRAKASEDAHMALKSHTDNENAELRSQLAHHKHKLALLRTPPQVSVAATAGAFACLRLCPLFSLLFF